MGRNNNYSPKVQEDLNSKENIDRYSNVKSRYLRETSTALKHTQKESSKVVPFRTGVSIERNYQKEKEKAGIPPISRTVSNTVHSNNAAKVNQFGIVEKEPLRYGNYQVSSSFLK